MSKHATSLIFDGDVESAYESALRCFAGQQYRLVRDDLPRCLEMERGNPWYSTIFLFPGYARSWKDHYCHMTASFMEEAEGKVRIECCFNWKYSVMRPIIMDLVDEEISGIGSSDQ